ncbi:MAG: DUF3737 family protein [Clostridia bacterium]|nr:DUF3737 family protein [Clostridia bacterium]
MNTVKNRRFDEERALYHLTDASVESCRFAGPSDGESALKEARNVTVKDCLFSLRYPLWHTQNFSLTASRTEETARAALWYCREGKIEDCSFRGVKAVRECSDVSIARCDIVSDEFGWKCRRITVNDTEITSGYLFLDSKDVTLSSVRMQGKYSFQYMENLSVSDSVLDTKDAFWHSKNVTVKNCDVNGEYLGWFSENLTFIDCRIRGTQPLCYCKNLTLLNCTMEECDLAFEYSEVKADIIGRIDSVKNPQSGWITADEIGETLWDNPIMPCTAKVTVR